MKDLTNKQFSRLKAIKPVKKPEHITSKRRGVFWLCECECGNEKIVRSTELLRGETKSCGCGNKFEKSHRYKGVGKLAQSKFSHIQWGAKKRGIEFSITIEYAWELYQNQEGKCYYTKLPIELNTRSHSMTASIDRVDSSMGYIEGNVVWVHKDVNIMKNSFSYEYFFFLCEKIVTNNCVFDPPYTKGNKILKENTNKNLD
jgi:hypothetical protein